MALNAFQTEVQKLAKKLGLQGADEQKVYANPQYQQLVGKFFGQIDLPAGVREEQVTFRSPSALEYKDEFGYTHKLQRNIDGRSPGLGQVEESSTDRPAVLPLSKTNPGIEEAMRLLTERTAKPFSEGLPDLDPDTLAQLQAIAKGNQDQLDQLFERGRADLVTGLYGSGTNRSTLANDASGRLLQEQGLVQSQKLSQDAERELNLRTGLRGQNIQLRDQDINYLMGLLGQDTARAVPSAQLSADQAKTRENARQFDLQYLLEQEKIKQQQRSGLMSALAGIASAGLSLIPGVGPILGAATSSIFGGITGGRGGPDSRITTGG
jgi:hypothetical protein